MMNKVLAVAAAVLLTTAVTDSAVAQNFYQGKQIKLIVSSATGGGYDAVARLLQRFMPQYIPGNPSIVVVNMPGAGGLLAANHFANLAEKDGTTLAVLNRFAAIMPLLGSEQAKFKTEEFQWIGTTASYSDNAYLLVIRSALPHQTIADLRASATPINIGNTGSDVPAILKEALGLNFKLISGYKGSEEMELAFERGEIDGHAISWLSMMARAPHWMDKGFARPVVQFGRADRLPIISHVPTARELTRGSESLALMLFAEAPLELGYPFALPPGVPAERVALLRKAFKDTTEDPKYIEEIQKIKLELTPKYGDEVQAIVGKLTQSPPSVVARYKALMGPAN